MSALSAILVGFGGLVVIDGVRHIALAWRVLYLWQSSPAFSARPRVRLRSERPDVFRTWSRAPAGAPREIARRYQRHARWSVAEVFAFIAICSLIVQTS